MKNRLIRLYAILLSTIFGIVFTAQILGFLGMYRIGLVLPLTLLTSIGAYWIYQRHTTNWLDSSITPQGSQSKLLILTTLITSISLVSIIFVQRMIFWYSSTLGRFIPSDFVDYHSIKVFQLVRDGSVWNLAIPYGQYPFGLESLIAFGMLIVPDIRITGLMFALVFIVLWLTLALLVMRFAQLSIDVSLLLATGLCLIPLVFPQLLNIGKNDVLLSTTILIAVLHAPIGNDRFHPYGLAFATMLSLATKATGLYILFYLWGLVMLNWFLHLRKGTWRTYLSPLTFIAVIFVMFPGGLWVIRNYLILGEVFTSEIASFFGTTIILNLDNPSLYSSWQSIDLLFHLVLATILGMSSLFYKRLSWQMLGLVIVISITFMVTPLAAFLTTNNLDYLDVQWRFVLHGLLLLGIILVVIIAPLIHRMYAWVSQHYIVSIGMSLGLISASVLLLYVIGFDDLFTYDAGLWEHVVDPTLQDDSIYDELAQLGASTVYIENLTWFSPMLRNENLILTELRYPLGRSEIYPFPDIEYIAIGRQSEPTTVIYQQYQWDIIFEDDTGIIYQRVR